MPGRWFDASHAGLMEPVPGHVVLWRYSITLANMFFATLTAIFIATILLAAQAVQAGPLHDAAYAGNLQKVKQLLSQGADVNARDKYKRTPLHLAAINGETEVADLLIRKGANVNVKNSDGDTPAMSAEENNHVGLAVSILARKFSGSSGLIKPINLELIKQIKTDWKAILRLKDSADPGMFDEMFFSYARLEWLHQLLAVADEPHQEIILYWIARVEDPQFVFDSSKLLMRMADAFRVRKIGTIAEQYYQHREDLALMTHRYDSSTNEIQMMRNTIAHQRRALATSIDSALQEVSQSSENWMQLKAFLKHDIETVASLKWKRIRSERSILGKMSRSVLDSIEDTQLSELFDSCLEKDEALELASINLLVTAFGPSVTAESTLDSEALQSFLTLQTESLACRAEMAVHPLVKHNERYQFLINSVSISIRIFLRKSELLVSGGKQALAYDAFAALAENYLAALYWSRDGLQQSAKIRKMINAFRKQQKKFLNNFGVNEQYAVSTVTNATEKALVLNLLVSLKKRFREWDSQVAVAKETAGLREVWVSAAMPYLLKADRFRRKWGDNDCNGGNCANAALAEYQKAIEVEPLDWRGWARFAQAEKRIGGSISVTVAYYDKALSLISRCAGQINAICPGIGSNDYETILLTDARLHLRLAHYSRAAELYAESLKSHKMESPAQWGAVARFAAENYEAAQEQYHATAEKPNRYDKKGSLEVMLRSGFVQLSNEAEKEGRLWDAYAHMQNIARLEAKANILQQPKSYTTDKLLKLYNRLTQQSRGAQVSPAMSPYGRAHAKAAYDFARHRKFYKARRNFRLALATDPWWVKGMSELAYVELMAVGLCGAIPTAERAFDLLKRVHLKPAIALNIGVPLRDSHDEWRELMAYANKNAADDEPGYCDPDPDLPNRVSIRPDREVLIAPE
jgi:tetratricopeptide (TPR) repeat protein